MKIKKKKENNVVYLYIFFLIFIYCILYIKNNINRMLINNILIKR